MRPLVVVLHMPGTNRDHDVVAAVERAGGRAEIVLAASEEGLQEAARRVAQAAMVVLPGGFTYGDALGAGALWASKIAAGRSPLGDALARFVEGGGPLLGVCNGFQALLRAGLLLGRRGAALPGATLLGNTSGRFESRWVTLKLERSPCVFLPARADGDATLRSPVAHAEGRFFAQPADLLELEASGAVVLRYARPDGALAEGRYPHNPNGSLNDIAGVCNPAGNVFGLMPHPENHLDLAQAPRGVAGARSSLTGLRLFEAGLGYARQF
ncbi:MAG: phosphoribosylformylglycinamidine synthase I [Deltaproteobacteria bacterium CG_4_9_14_3_um_filter_63_12]|nr:MAG: phosphoribosylformylglycinamidine synthase I [Deltaproteobacteria bacterium CG_4_9_14_3_um_filter_63_12]